MDEQLPSGISRRSALKRLGAGAAIAWSAPVLMSINAHASAASDVCGPGSVCVHCGGGTICHHGNGPVCRCSPPVGGGCFCGQVVGCGQTHTCISDANC